MKKTKIRKAARMLVAVYLCLVIFCLPVHAQQQTASSQMEDFIGQKLDELWDSELSQSVPDGAKEVLEKQGMGKKGISGILSMTPDEFLGMFIDAAKETIRKPLNAIGKMLGVILLCAVLGAMQQSGISSRLRDIFTITAAAGMVTFLSDPVLGCIRQTVTALRECSLFLLSFTPVMSGLVIAGGNPASAGTYHMLLFFAAEILAELAAKTLIPLLCIYLALCIVAPLAPFLHISELTSGIKNMVCWGLGILTTIFVGMLSLQTIIGSGGDSLLLKTSKFLAGSFIPVIGGTISDALGAAKGCMQVLKSAVGSFGILVAALSFLPALMEVCLWYLAVRILAWVSVMLGAKEVSDLLSCIAQTFSILLAMIGCFMLLILVSTTVMLLMTVG